MCYDHTTLANFKGGDLGDNFDSNMMTLNLRNSNFLVIILKVVDKCLYLVIIWCVLLLARSKN